MNKNEIVAALKALYERADTVTLRYDGSEANKRTLMDQRQSLYNIYFAAVAADLQDFNNVVSIMVDELKALKDDLDGRLADLQNINGIINLLAEGIKLGGSIVTLAKV